MRWPVIYILIFSVFSLGLDGQSIEETRHYSDHKFDEGEYELALQGYNRILFFDSIKEWQDLYKIAVCQWNLNEKNKALKSLNQSYFICEEDSGLAAIYFKKIEFLLRLSKYEELLEEIKISDLNLDSSKLQREFFYQGVCYYTLCNYSQSISNFSMCFPAEDSLALNRLALIFDDTLNFNSPSSKKAKILSYFLPGLGQTYAGNHGDALNSFILNTAFIGLYIYSAQAYTILDATLFVFPLVRPYYAGGVENAKQAALARQEEKKAQTYFKILALFEK